jgi:glycosyltransferase involved in cell wall biosynthesis
MLGQRDDVEQVLTALDAFSLSSHSEGLPLVLLEAMATGLPVHSTNVGGIPDLVTHGVTGLLSPDGDRAAITRQLESLSTNGSLARQLAKAGRDHVLQRHSDERMAAEYTLLYERTLASRRAARAPRVGSGSGRKTSSGYQAPL